MRIVKNISLIIVASILVALPSNIFADGVTVEEVPGNTVIPVQQDDVRMIREVVRVDKEEVVTATFTFENMTQKNIVFPMGFPFSKGTDPLAVSQTVSGHGKFLVRINGKQVQWNKMSASENTKLKIGADYAFMYVWQISFQPNEKKTVECIYTASWSCDVGPYPSCWHFTYITKTGALWKGTIEQADFYITLSDYDMENYKAKKIDFNIEPLNYKIAGNTIEWHFNNWEPTQDISIALARSKSYPLEDFEIKALLLEKIDFNKTYEANVRLYTLKDLWDRSEHDSVNKLYIKFLRNEIFARHGRPFKDETLQWIFKNFRWYKPNPNYSDSMLNEYEKKNMEFILNYEREKGWTK